MTSFQKGVKIFAISLAIVIIFSILSCFIGMLEFASFFFDSSPQTENRKIVYPSDFNLNDKDISDIDIELSSTSLEIVPGETFKIETYNSDRYVKVTTKNGVLKVEETAHHWHHNDRGRVVLEIPQNRELSSLDIDMGAGKASMEDVYANTLNFSQGAGTLIIENCNFAKTEIDGGAGKMTIRNSHLGSLELDSGVGKVDIEAYLEGSSEIDSDVGALSLTLLGDRESYTVRAEKGLGSLSIDGEQNASTFGRGPNYVEIDGGVGSIEIKFRD